MTDRPSPPSCPQFAINGPALVSPAAGSAGVSATLTVLTFDRLRRHPADFAGNTMLSGSDGPTLASGPCTPSSNFSTTTASIASLHPHTNYTVKVRPRLHELVCRNDGTFTTQ